MSSEQWPPQPVDAVTADGNCGWGDRRSTSPLLSAFGRQGVRPLCRLVTRLSSAATRCLLKAGEAAAAAGCGRVGRRPACGGPAQAREGPPRRPPRCAPARRACSSRAAGRPAPPWLLRGPRPATPRARRPAWPRARARRSAPARTAGTGRRGRTHPRVERGVTAGRGHRRKPLASRNTTGRSPPGARRRPCRPRSACRPSGSRPGSSPRR